MKDSFKKYIPYATIIFAIYIVVPLIFRNGALSNFVSIAWYFIFPATAALSAAVYCSKYGLDFLFSLIAPIFFLPSMFLFYGGVNLANILLLIVYLIAGLFGLFAGDIALGDKRRAREKKEKAEAEEMLLEAKRRDERELEKLAADSQGQAEHKRHPSAQTNYSNNDDDFDYDKYLSDIDRKSNATEAEIDDILSEYNKH